MIRMNPAHDTVNPPGCSIPGQQNVVHQEKTLEREIEIYRRGFQDGLKQATTTLPQYTPQYEYNPFKPHLGPINTTSRTSEYDR